MIHRISIFLIADRSRADRRASRDGRDLQARRAAASECSTSFSFHFSAPARP
jgi:hypothetical protein